MKQNELTQAKNSYDIFPVQEVHHLEMYVGNAKQTAYFFANTFGFTPIAYSGLETKVRDKVSYVLKQGSIRLVITGTLKEDSKIAEFVKKHGDGVKDIALIVDDIEKAYQGAVSRGAIKILPPTEISDEYGTVKKAVIGTYGDTIHTLIEKKDYKGVFLPGFKASCVYNPCK
ncbi:4-hydroxyphenylpyruvate dioxygenase [Bacillus sp. OAE603]